MSRPVASPADYWKRTVKWSGVEALRLEGYKVGVLHLHSSFSRDVPDLDGNRPEALLDKGIRQGADYIAITDHDNDDAWRRAGHRPPCWIRGVEMEVFDRRRIGHPVHLGLLNIADDRLSDRLHEIAHERHDADRLVRTALDNGVTVIANHPWWGPRGYHINSVRYWHFIEKYRLPVEVNDKRSLIENIAAVFYASHRNLPVVATTDSHTRKLLPTCTLAKGATIGEYLENLRRGETYIVPGYAGLVSVPAMMARYVLDVIRRPLPADCYRQSPLRLGAAPLVDRIISLLSSNHVVGRCLRNPLVSGLAGPLTYLVGALLYLPTAYAASSLKVLRDLYERSALSVPLPELITE
ncbi:MAG: hypothetical protein V1794_18380 [Candidatus Glassbacteria bacterium]